MADEGTTQLRRILGVAFGIGVAIGGTIGQGILRAPGGVAAGIPSAGGIVAIWIAGGILSAIDLTCTVELASAIRRTGGPYIFVRIAFGPLAGLAVGLADCLSNIGAIAFISVVFGEYLHRLGILTGVGIGVLAAGLPMMLGLIQLLGTRVAGRSQEFGSAIKCVLLLILVGALLLAPRGAAIVESGPPATLTALGLVAAIRSIMGTYNGWNGAAYFCEEVIDPRKSIARASFVALAVVTAIYVLVNVAMLHVLTPAEMAGDNLVAAKAAAHVFGARADLIVTAVSLVSLITVTNMVVMLVPRILFAIARDAGVPVLSKVAPNGTPRAALIVTVVIAVVLGAIGVYDTLLALSTSLFVAVFVAVDLAAIRLRTIAPAMERPYRMPLYPLPVLVALTVNLAIMIAYVVEDPRDAALGFALLGVLTTICLVVIHAVRAQSGVATAI